MPRIYTSNNDPLDFCRDCFPTEEEANAEYGDMGDGPDGRGNCFTYDADHPAYSDTDERCHSCRRRLTDRDNDPKPSKTRRP